MGIYDELNDITGTKINAPTKAPQQIRTDSTTTKKQAAEAINTIILL